MIKKISVNQLKIGMFIHDLNCGWMNHPFLQNRFMVDDDATLNKIIRTGVEEVSIDTSRGADVSVVEPDMDWAEEVVASLPEPSSMPPSIICKLSSVEELKLAEELCCNATRLVQDIMRDVRLGKQIAVEQCEPMVSDIVDSMFRMPSALLPVVQMKNLDEYTFQHSVCVSALAVAFGRTLGLPRNEIHEIALGGFLHDVGKAKVPEDILNKPGKLTDEEFEIIKGHVSFTAELLNDAGIGEIALNAAAQHHERFDGTGYPYGLKGDQICLHGQMLAIVDVYDAITSARVYHKAMPPTEALRKLFEWGDKFNPTLVQAFIKSIGIYPAGSLVRLESNRLAIVREVLPDKLLHPIVQLIYDCKELCHIPPEWIDLSDSNDKIKSHESFEKWGIDQASWVAAYS